MSIECNPVSLGKATPEEQFLDRIAQVIDAGAVSVMLSVGHRLGLFDTLAKLPPSTSVQIAVSVGCVACFRLDPDRTEKAIAG